MPLNANDVLVEIIPATEAGMSHLRCRFVNPFLMCYFQESWSTLMALVELWGGELGNITTYSDNGDR